MKVDYYAKDSKIKGVRKVGNSWEAFINSKQDRRTKHFKSFDKAIECRIAWEKELFKEKSNLFIKSKDMYMLRYISLDDNMHTTITLKEDEENFIIVKQRADGNIEYVKICSKCENELSPENFENNRNTCNKCRHKNKHNKETLLKSENVALYYSNKMSEWARSRVISPSKQSRSKTYSNLEEPFGFKNTKEMSEFIYNKFKTDIENIIKSNKTPSIDRIDTSKGYTKENIRVISLRNNTLLGVETRKRKVLMIDEFNNEKIFNTVTECAEYFGYDRTHSSKVSHWVRYTNGGISKYRVPKGYRFYYLN